MKALGRHLLVEFFDCDPKRLDDTAQVEKWMEEAARRAGATIVQSVFHRFQPHGVSGVVVIAESHLAIHTWPEYGYAAVDLFTCGATVDPWIAHEILKDAFAAGNWATKELMRGELKGIDGELHYKPATAVA
ncbi:MAG: S-adenosylmethionine decarboxylase proenzyme [Deltaproteobacteria bacterium]|nr:S-adenosylmethionine decarboxylase proenzyme [Candidatus Anaeroferrophillus wilburensis]MBN2890114.1 S-adenosylmethionine decarboxylase proenzyme [Deltaproteobacteria bacterium]